MKVFSRETDKPYNNGSQVIIIETAAEAQALLQGMQMAAQQSQPGSKICEVSRALQEGMEC